MSHQLFPAWSWKRALPAPFDDFSVEQRSTDYGSVHNKGKTLSTLHTGVLKALLKAAELHNAVKDGTYSIEQGAMGRQNEDYLLAELPDTDGNRQTVCYVRSTGSLKINVFAPDGSSSPYTMMSAKDRNGTAIFFTLMNPNIWDSEFERHFLLFAELAAEDPINLEGIMEHAYILCDNIYRRIEAAGSLGDAGLPVKIPSTGNIPVITPLNLRQGTYSPTDIVLGEFQELGKVSAAKSKIKVSSSGFAGKYKYHTRTLGEEEQALVPEIEPWYVIPPEVELICKHSQETSLTNFPMRNFMMRGGAGTGKTEMAKAIAAGLGLPYVYLTCSANMELMDILGQILPEIDDGMLHSVSGTLPSFLDIQMDPSTAYLKLTGKPYNTSITEEDVYQCLMKAMRSSSAETSDKTIFQYAETPLVQAFRYGWVCELQEVAVIQQPGVLVGLNALLDRCGSIILPTGECVERHPDTLLVLTTNVDYEGCRGVNQSVISRMNLILDIEDLDEHTMMERVQAVTGFSDTAILNRMVTIVKETADYCRASMITDGSCGMRELTAWVQSFMVSRDLLQSVKYTVLSSASSDPENRKELLDSCILPRIED